jgi:hypothetical protein
MRLRATWALAASFCLLCLGCGQRETLSGGYDDVENPALAVTLLDTLGHPFQAGEMRIYARYQNPGKDSTPLLEKVIASGSNALVRDTDLVSAMAAAESRGTPWPSRDTVEFNLSLTGTGTEAYLGDFLMVRGADGFRRFLRRSGGAILHADAQGVLTAAPVLAAPILGQRGNIGARGAALALESVFIPGSPYRAAVAGDGSFTFARMAKGNFDVKAVSADGKKIYTASDSLETGGGYAPADWAEADLLWIE